MGLFLSRFQNILSRNKVQHRILLLGLDAAGKTTILYKLKLQETVITVPTIGFNVEEVEIPGTGASFTVWDVGGQEKLRRLWRHYYTSTSGLIFVVDSADAERLEEARDELHGVLNDEAMQGVPFVLLANKQDMPNALAASQLENALCLDKLRAAKHSWHVQLAVATTGEGLCEAFETMARMAKAYKKNSR